MGLLVPFPLAVAAAAASNARSLSCFPYSRTPRDQCQQCQLDRQSHHQQPEGNRKVCRGLQHIDIGWCDSDGQEKKTDARPTPRCRQQNTKRTQQFENASRQNHRPRRWNIRRNDPHLEFRCPKMCDATHKKPEENKPQSNAFYPGHGVRHLRGANCRGIGLSALRVDAIFRGSAACIALLMQSSGHRRKERRIVH
jgi:hypothetical protein